MGAVTHRTSARVILGDARLQLAGVAAESFERCCWMRSAQPRLPCTLLTREAVEMYASKPRDRGVLLFHTSNLHVDVEGVLLNVSGSLGYTLRSRHG